LASAVDWGRGTRVSGRDYLAQLLPLGPRFALTNYLEGGYGDLSPVLLNHTSGKHLSVELRLTFAAGIEVHIDRPPWPQLPEPPSELLDAGMRELLTELVSKRALAFAPGREEQQRDRLRELRLDDGSLEVQYAPCDIEAGGRIVLPLIRICATREQAKSEIPVAFVLRAVTPGGLTQGTMPPIPFDLGHPKTASGITYLGP
jgi:hypothetical protein